MGVTGTNADGSLTLWLSFEPSPGDLKPQHHLMVAGDPEEDGDVAKGPTVSEHPQDPGEDSVASRDQALQPCFASAITRWNGQQPRRVLLFPKYVCCINTVIKGEPSVSDGGGGSLFSDGWLCPASPGQHGEERPCSPSGCQAIQTLLSSTSTLLEHQRYLGRREATGRRRGAGQGVTLNCSQAPRPC